MSSKAVANDVHWTARHSKVRLQNGYIYIYNINQNGYIYIYNINQNGYINIYNINQNGYIYIYNINQMDIFIFTI